MLAWTSKDEDGNGLYGSLFDNLFNLLIAAENLIVIMCTFSLLAMFLFTFLMVAKNSSLAELRNPKDLYSNIGLFNVGTVKNINSIMGDNVLLWFIPFKKITRECNGIDFTINPNLE
jgi:hypothetical protein